MQGKILFIPLHRFRKATGLSHGVMVALQFLVLSVEVRILVRQLTIIESRLLSLDSKRLFYATNWKKSKQLMAL